MTGNNTLNHTNGNLSGYVLILNSHQDSKNMAVRRSLPSWPVQSQIKHTLRTYICLLFLYDLYMYMPCMYTECIRRTNMGTYPHRSRLTQSQSYACSYPISPGISSIIMYRLLHPSTDNHCLYVVTGSPFYITLVRPTMNLRILTERFGWADKSVVGSSRHKLTARTNSSWSIAGGNSSTVHYGRRPRLLVWRSIVVVVYFPSIFASRSCAVVPASDRASDGHHHVHRAAHVDIFAFFSRSLS